MKPATKITVTVRVEHLDAHGKIMGHPWERSVSEFDEFPSPLAQQQLLTVAHAQIHPPRREPTHRHD